MRRLLLGAVAALVAAGALTYWAGEQTEVVVLRTADAAGRRYETKMWAVDHEGDPWVRVANPERAWYRRLLEQPGVELLRNGQARRYTAEPHDTPESAAASGSAASAPSRSRRTALSSDSRRRRTRSSSR